MNFLQIRIKNPENSECFCSENQPRNMNVNELVYYLTDNYISKDLKFISHTWAKANAYVKILTAFTDM